MSFESFNPGKSAPERGVRHVLESGKKIIMSPAQVDWKKQGVVGGVMDSATNAALTTVGETTKLASYGIGWVIGKTRDAVMSVVGGAGSVAKTAILNAPILPLPAKHLGPNALNAKLDQWSNR